MVDVSTRLWADTIRAIEWDCARLINRYALLNDAHRWDEVTAMFIPDGRLTRPSAPDAPIVGHAAILAAFLARPARTTRHVCSNIVIEVLDHATARGESAMLLFTDKDSAPLIGGFKDRFVRTADGWRFAERRGTLSF